VEEVHHGTARALSRRLAAHKFGSHDGSKEAHTATHASSGPIDVEESWAHVLKAIHGGGHSADALAKAAVASRHAASQHVAEIGKGKSWVLPVTVGLVTIGVAVGAVMIIDKLGEDRVIAQAVNSADVRDVNTGTAQLGDVKLDDGTAVRLAPESKLVIPKTFGPELRAVRLDGSATFVPAPGQVRPLQVHLRNAVVIATGTKFVVGSYQADPVSIIQVTEGTVGVRVADSVRTLAAGQSLLVDKDGAVREPTADEIEESIGWTQGKLTIVNRQLRDVLPQLRRWYALDVKVPELPVLDRPVTLRVPLDSTRMAVAQVEKSANVRYQNINNVKVFMDAKGKAAKKK
jgi:ferric-dicitrate binding protein FerR (iron transport regulator)